MAKLIKNSSYQRQKERESIRITSGVTVTGSMTCSPGSTVTQMSLQRAHGATRAVLGWSFNTTSGGPAPCRVCRGSRGEWPPGQHPALPYSRDSCLPCYFALIQEAGNRCFSRPEWGILNRRKLTAFPKGFLYI